MGFRRGRCQSFQPIPALEFRRKFRSTVRQFPVTERRGLDQFEILELAMGTSRLLSMGNIRTGVQCYSRKSVMPRTPPNPSVFGHPVVHLFELGSLLVQ